MKFSLKIGEIGLKGRDEGGDLKNGGMCLLFQNLFQHFTTSFYFYSDKKMDSDKMQ